MKRFLIIAISFAIQSNVAWGQWTIKENGPEGVAPSTVAYGAGLIVAAKAFPSDESTTIYHSADGESWESVKLDTGLFVDSLQFLNDRFVLTAQSTGRAYVYSSTDGINWTPNISNRTAFPVAAKVTYAENQYVIAGGGAGNRNIAISSDLASWTQVSMPSYSYLEGIAFGDGTWVVTSMEPAILYSTDSGTTWTSATLPTGNRSYSLGDISYGDGLFIATGRYDSSTGTEPTSLLLTSSNGVDWTLLETSHRRYAQITYAEGTFALSGTSVNNEGVAVFTDDGQNLTSDTLPFASSDGNIENIIYADGLWLVTSSSGNYAVQGSMGSNSGSQDTWRGYDLVGGWADTGGWLGMVEVSHLPYVFVQNLGKYVYFPDDSDWVFVPGP